MTELTFRLIVSLTVLVTVAGIGAEEFGSRRLSEPLRTVKAQMKSLTVASSKQNPIYGLMRISLVLGYLISLVALAFFVPFSPWTYLFFTIAWSILAVIDAPHILPRPFVPLYEASLILNGAILGLCFLSPLAMRFSAP
ncbi:hypothetical protein [Pseudoxanthomonas mexicana]